MPMLRSAALEIARSLPTGDPTRRQILAALKEARDYEEYVKDFESRKENRGKQPMSQSEWRESQTQKTVRQLKQRSKSMKELLPKQRTEFRGLVKELSGLKGDKHLEMAEKIMDKFHVDEKAIKSELAKHK